MERLRVWLDARSPWRWAAVLAVVVGLPTLGLGLNVDDHLLRAALAGGPRFARVANPWWDAFHMWAAGMDHARAVGEGLGPWWADPSMHARFFRPLSSAQLALELRLFVDAPWVMHALSVGWYAAVCALAAVAYRRWLTGWAAGLAAVLFTIDWTHGMLIGWIANRNALIAAAGGFAALLLHARGRRGLAAGALALGLCGGEAALGTAAYLLAHALCLEDGPLRTRLARLWPYAVVGAAWLAIYVVGAYGVRGSGLYLDPRRDPLGFVVALPAHAILLLGAELGAMGPDPYVVLGPTGRVAFVAIAAAAVGLAAVALRPVLRADRVARFFAVGAVLSVIPLCATFPSARLTLVPGFGVMALIARVLVAWVDGARTGVARRVFVGLVALGHLVLALPLLLFMQRQAKMVDDAVLALNRGVPHVAPDERLVVVNPPDPLFMLYLVAQRLTLGTGVPAGALALGQGIHALTIERAADDAVIVRDPRGFFGDGFSMLTRPPGIPMDVGARVAFAYGTIEVMGAAGGVPTAVRVRFTTPLDDPGLRWVAWDGATLVPFTPPALGKTVALDAHRHPLILW